MKHKKGIVFICCVCMLLLIGCGVMRSQNPATDQVKSEPVKIGFCGWGYSDKLGGAYLRYLKYIEEDFDIQFAFRTGDTREQQNQNVEKLIQEGCDGIIVLKVTGEMIEKCEAAGVWLAQFGSEPADPELLAYLEESPYWVGYSKVDDYECGKRLMKALYDSGARNVIVCASATANAVHDLRWAGALDEAEELPDLNVVAKFRVGHVNQYGNVLREAVSVYPQIDGILTASGSAGGIESVIRAIEEMGKTGEILAATADIEGDTGVYFEKGILTCAAGGQYPEVVFLSLCMLDKINGVSTAEKPVKLEGKMIYIYSAKEYREYKRYIENAFPYTLEELKAVTTSTNSEAAYEDMWKLWNSYSLSKVEMRHGDMEETP